MTKEELEKEAEELFNKKPLGYAMNPELEIYTDGFKDGYNKAKEEMIQNGLALQSDMDKTIEQNISLKEQIEKLKYCENCKHHCFWGNELNCRTLSYAEELKCMKTKEHWEIKE